MFISMGSKHHQVAILVPDDKLVCFGIDVALHVATPIVDFDILKNWRRTLEISEIFLSTLMINYASAPLTNFAHIL